MHARRWGCIGSLIVSGALLLLGVAGVLHTGQRVAAAITPQPGGGATISWQPRGPIVTAYAERLRLWPPQQIHSQDTLHLPGWPGAREAVPSPGQRVRVFDIQARPGDCYRLVEGAAAPGPAGQTNYRYQQTGIVCWLTP